MSKLKNFLDEKGRIKSWPGKRRLKIEVLKYMADKFEENRLYDEKEVNTIINAWHTYGDYFMLRRGMVDYKLLYRKRDGSKYWKVNEKEIIT